jgi:hypothetical protein
LDFDKPDDVFTFADKLAMGERNLHAGDWPNSASLIWRKATAV